MLKVEFESSDGEGDGYKVVGTLLFDGKKITADPPDSPRLQNVLAEPIPNWSKHRERKRRPEEPPEPLVSADKNPAEFMANLYLQYHGSRFSASRPIEVADASSMPAVADLLKPPQ